MVPCYAAKDAEEASLLVLQLRAHGIDARTRADHGAVAFGELPADVLRVDVYVPEDQLASARERVRAFLVDSRAAAGSRGAPWICPSCREENEATFEICWNCQTAVGP